MILKVIGTGVSWVWLARLPLISFSEGGQPLTWQQNYVFLQPWHIDCSGSFFHEQKEVSHVESLPCIHDALSDRTRKTD